MKKIWILSIRTSLPYSCRSASELKSEAFAYETFEKAREAFYDKYTELVYLKNNEMFDNGVLSRFDDYIDGIYEPDEYEAHDFTLTKDMCNKIKLALHGVLYRKKVELDIEDGRYSDGTIDVAISNGEIEISGIYHGDINDGYSPVVSTNVFDMTTEKDYYLYIDDAFGQLEDSCELYIDLMEAELQ